MTTTMNFVKSTALLKKINALHDSATAFDGTMSLLEKDLILQYLRDLYEVIKTDGSETDHIRKTPASTIPEVMAPVERPSAVVPAATEILYEDEKPSVAPVKEFDEELLNLFALSESKDVSMRVGALPISDLAKSMGINDRILIKNDLFGGSQQVMDDAISTLNRFTTFDEAKEYLLSSVADDHDWAKGDRRERAIAFIRLVRRRYL